MKKKCIFSQVENADIRDMCAGQIWFWVWAIFSGLRGLFKSYEMCADVDTKTLHTRRKACILLCKTFKGWLHLHWTL